MSAKPKKRKRLSRKMKATIRITAASLFMISAVIVALLPNRDTKANQVIPTVTITDDQSPIPVISPTDTIYTTGDGMFQFAYIDKISGGNKVAVICGYDYERSLEGGNLTIPDTVDAYVKFTHSMGTSDGYIAVGRSNNPLYYPIYTQVPQLDINGDPVLDSDGNPVMDSVVDRFEPCLYSSHDNWYYVTDSTGATVPRDMNDYYYEDPTNPGQYLQTTTDPVRRITGAEVNYISSQHVVKDGNGGWQLDPSTDEGIFSRAGNIKYLTTGSQLLGIGNYAFMNCASLQGITLGDGANVIGNHAFEGCINMKSVDIPTNSALINVGDHAFYNCRSLENFTIPVRTETLGDSCFEGCRSLADVDLSGGGQQVALRRLGNDVFKDCSALTSLTLPDYYIPGSPSADDGKFDISWLEGCTSLEYVRLPNASQVITDASGYTFDNFKDQVIPEFYFEGFDLSDIHDVCKDHTIAFKYLNEQKYEKVVDSNPSTKQVYTVNNNNELIGIEIGPNVSEVILPDNVGPYNITSIGTYSFQNNCNIKKIHIPSSITSIGVDAFKGCHNLKDVIFNQPINLNSIGDGAFDTQFVDNCTCGNPLASQPVLTFTGVAEKGSLPFDYAMNPDNNINNGEQVKSYITFFTGWPSNMTVKYNEDNDKIELVDYPRLEELDSLTTDQYPYLTTQMAAAATNAKQKYSSGEPLTEYEQQVLSSALNVKIPSGVEMIKKGLFSNLDENGNEISSLGSPDNKIQTITTENLEKIDPYTFAGCTGLVGAYINGQTYSLGDYAFDGCTNLRDVDLYSNLSNFGKVPFVNCDALDNVDFGDNHDYECFDAIIYERDSNGNRATILECLDGRGKTYGSSSLTAVELENVTAVAPEAFRGCDGVVSVDFSKSSVTAIPERCFEDTPDLYSVTLSRSTQRIGQEAFKNSNIRYVDIPTTTSVIDSTAFDGDMQTITFYTEQTSPAAYYAANYPNIIVADKPKTFTVEYWVEGESLPFATKVVNEGEDSELTKEPVKDGYYFVGWMPEPKNVTENMKVYAQFSEVPRKQHTVTFIDWDDKELYIMYPFDGEDCLVPKDPVREGYVFTGWRPAITNVKEDIKTYAQYEKKSDNPSGSGSSQGSSSSQSGSSSGSSGSQSSNPSNNGNKGSSANGLYTLTVVEGSGSGSYAPGTTVIIVANTPASGKVFEKWTTDSQNIQFASTTVAATTIVMPAANLQVKANFKDTGSSNNNNKASTSGGRSSSNNGGSSTKNTGTTVYVDKSGFSNTGLASATVSGSADNFILKITDDAEAKAAVVDALMAKYDSLDNIKYLAMDISLYDATGKNKITNYDDLKVSVTLPIPDELLPYAGNNKIGYVLNGKMNELSVKYTTINGVPCMTFVAPHFSPYAIYVDTSNLQSGEIYDVSPKTGDGIAPKWFLALGLACISVFLFALRGKRTKIKVNK